MKTLDVYQQRTITLVRKVKWRTVHPYQYIHIYKLLEIKVNYLG